MSDHVNEYHLSDEEATAILLESPDTTLVADYLSGALSAADQVAFRERLRLDPTFREFAESHIAVWEAVPVAQPTLSPDDLQASWARFQDRVGMPRERAVAPTAPVQHRPWPQLRRMQLAAALLLIIGIPSAVYLGDLVMPLLRPPRTQMVVGSASGHEVRLDRRSTVTLSQGTRFIWTDKATRDRPREMYLAHGNARFVLEKVAPNTYVVETPAGRITVTGTIFFVSVQNPTTTTVRVEEGEVLLDPAGVATMSTPLRLSAGSEGIMVWGAPPALLRASSTSVTDSTLTKEKRP